MRVDVLQPRDYNRIKVEPISGALGAEITGVDMRDLDDELVAELRQAWMDHLVIFFRDQDLTPQQHVEYGRAFGEVEIHPFTDNLEGQPEVIVLESSPEKFVAAESWHSDVTFRECPPMGSVERAALALFCRRKLRVDHGHAFKVLWLQSAGGVRVESSFPASRWGSRGGAPVGVRLSLNDFQLRRRRGVAAIRRWFPLEG